MGVVTEACKEHGAHVDRAEEACVFMLRDLKFALQGFMMKV